MASTKINHFKYATMYLILLGVLGVFGCDFTDNPPPTLHMAAFKGNIKAASQFLNSGVPVDANGPDGEKPLHFAVYGNRVKMITFLLDKGADINAVNGAGRYTPLHGAAWKGHFAATKLLIARGADINAVNDNGKTPLDWAIEQGHTQVAQLIRDHGGIEGTQGEVN